MIDTPSAEKWLELRRQRPSVGLVRQPVLADGAPTGCWLAVDPAGDLCLLVPLKADPPPLPPDLNGVSLRCLVASGELFLSLAAKFSHEGLFSALCAQILRAIVIQRRDPALASIACVKEWQRAFRPVTRDLEPGVQVGLFGELWTMWRILIPVLGPGAAHTWSGPLAERHDFVGPGCHIEVKTTRRDAERHEISRLDQLRAPDGKQLLLVSVRVEESIAGQETLATKRAEILELLASDAEATDLFEEKMRRIGWHNGLVQSGSLLRFSLRGVSVFQVSGDFPRLPDDYQPPKGVSGIRYTIDVANERVLDAKVVAEIVRKGLQ